ANVSNRVPKDISVLGSDLKILHSLELETLMAAFVNGYEIEETPEEKLLKYYKNEANFQYREDYGDGHRDGILTGIESTLNILGIKIEGINKPKEEFPYDELDHSF